MYIAFKYLSFMYIYHTWNLSNIECINHVYADFFIVILKLQHSFIVFFLLTTRNIQFGSVIKNLPASSGDVRSIPGSGRSPGEGNDIPLQYSCLENPKDRGAWWATVHVVAKNWTQLSDWACNTCKHTINQKTMAWVDTGRYSLKLPYIYYMNF